MSKVWILLAIIILPIVSSERRALLTDAHNHQKKSLISRFIQTVQTYSPHMAFGGIMCGQLCFTVMDTLAEEGCASCIEPVTKAAICCCICGVCCGCVGCNECRKEWKKHAKN